MFKSKGAMIGVAAALVASALLVAGMAFTTTAGAGTDTFGGVPGSGFPAPSDPGLGNPPAAEEEEPGTVPGTDPGNPAGTAPGSTQPTTGVDPSGSADAGNAAPGTLPNAGFGLADGSASGAFVVLLALAGTALIGVGATVVSSSRRS